MKNEFVITAFAALLLLTACSGDRRYDIILGTADSLMDSRPDSALTLLNTLDVHEHRMGKQQHMKWLLLRTAAQNKCDTIFHTDAIQQSLTEYYDRHGTANERMTAYYLLGRALADMGDTPEAMRAYQKAVEVADTTSADCNLRTLCAIFGQEAAIFEIQRMPREQQEALRQYSHFAKKNGQTYNYIKGLELQLSAFFAMDDTANCFRITEECRRLYTDNGMEKEAESVYPTAILIHLEDSQYTKARVLMQAFEVKSGLFDSEGNIQHGREHYYNSKGMYYNGVNQLDSAEYYFRKLTKYQISYNYDAYKGLLQVYRKRVMPDSIVKYSILSEMALDSIHNESQAEALALAVSSYNYAKKEKLAKEKTIEVANAWKALSISVFLLVIASFVIFLLFMKRKEREKQLSQLGTDYMKALEKSRKTEEELEDYKTDSKKTIKEKEKEIEHLHQEINDFKNTINNLNVSEKESVLNSNDVVKKFQEVIIDRFSFHCPNDNDWMNLKQIIRQCLPLFTMKVIDSGMLGDQEQKICILTRIGLHNGVIVLLLNISPQSVTNAKTKANRKLFGDDKAQNLFKNLRNPKKLSL